EPTARTPRVRQERALRGPLEHVAIVTLRRQELFELEIRLGDQERGIGEGGRRRFALSMQLEHLTELVDGSFAVTEAHEHFARSDALGLRGPPQTRTGRRGALDEARFDGPHRALGFGLRSIVVESPRGPGSEASGEEDDRAHSPDRPNLHHFVPAPIDAPPDAPARTAPPAAGAAGAGFAAVERAGAAGPVTPVLI